MLRAVNGSSQAPLTNCRPNTSMLPPSGAARPDKISSSSVCPLPETPAIPTISPARNCSATSVSRCTPLGSRKCKPWASKAGVASRCASAVVGGLSKCTLRPTIACASASKLARAIGISSTTRPARITVTWSQRANTSLSLWVIKITVFPCARNWRNTANNCWVSCGVNTAVGSSKIRMRAPRYRAFKISKRWRSPTAKSATVASSATRSPVDCIKASKRSRTGALALGKCQCGSAPSITFSSALSVSTNMKCWCTIPMPQAIASSALRI